MAQVWTVFDGTFEPGDHQPGIVRVSGKGLPEVLEDPAERGDDAAIEAMPIGSRPGAGHSDAEEQASIPDGLPIGSPQEWPGLPIDQRKLEGPGVSPEQADHVLDPNLAQLRALHDARNMAEEVQGPGSSRHELVDCFEGRDRPDALVGGRLFEAPDSLKPGLVVVAECGGLFGVRSGKAVLPKLQRHILRLRGGAQPVLEDQLFPGKLLPNGALYLQLETSMRQRRCHIFITLVLNELSTRLQLCGGQ